MNALLCFLVMLQPPVDSRPIAVQLTFSKKVAAQPFTGRVFLVASRSEIKGGPPRQQWFKPFPFFAQDVRDWQPEEPTRKYPVIYEIPGFGGDHFGALGCGGANKPDVAGVEMIHVTLDPSCRLGHHVFADSDNNGPCGRALIEELIPAIETKFRG